METEKMIDMVRKFRADLIQEINLRCDDMIQQIRETKESGPDNEDKEKKWFESMYPLSSPPGIFKGKKPTGVLFPDETRENAHTWKKVAEAILKRCNADPNTHNKLMELRGKVAGRERILLGGSDETMHSPVQIDEELYMETHYDTETLLKIITVRILQPVAYDYSGIKIAIRNDG